MKCCHFVFKILLQYIMWQVILGFSAGVYVGTYYDCKPYLKQIHLSIKDKLPEEKNKK